MRILYVAAGTPVPGTHGGSVHALQLCRALARAGHEVHLVALPAASGADATQLDGVILHPLPRRPPVAQLEWTLWRRVRAVAEQVGPEIVVERFYTFGGTGLLAARALGVPAVLEVNSPARPYPGSLRDLLDRLTLVRPVDRWRRWQLRHAAAYYATAEVLLPARLRGRTTVIVNGVDVERFRPGPEAPDTGPLRLVYVSSFRSWHGAEDLVVAVAEATGRGADLELVAIGAGPTLEAARELARERGIDAGVRFTGPVPHERVADELAAAHVGVAPFSPERHRALEMGWFWSPIKIFEYMAAGLPVVTADIARLRELLPGDVARFYPPGDVDALADVLVALARDREQVRRSGREARLLVRQRYTWDQQAARVRAVLEGVLADA